MFINICFYDYIRNPRKKSPGPTEFIPSRIEQLVSGFKLNPVPFSLHPKGGKKGQNITEEE